MFAEIDPDETGFPGVCDSDPNAQKYPALHMPLTAVRPSTSQYDPGEQSVHSEAFVSASELLKLPLGHRYSVANAVPSGQYEPAGHSRPTRLVIPAAVASQTYPAGHGLHVDCWI